MLACRRVHAWSWPMRGTPTINAIAYRTPGYPLTPVIFLMLTALLLFLLGGHDPKKAFLGVSVVALGLPVYYLLFVRSNPVKDSR